MQCPHGDVPLAPLEHMLRCPAHGMFVLGAYVRSLDRLQRQLDKIPEGVPSRLTCPDCKGAMNQLAGKKITIEQCQSCDGLWLDDGEEIILRRAERMDGWTGVLVAETVLEVAFYTVGGLASLLG